MPTRLLAATAAGVGVGLAFEPVHLVWLLPAALALFFGAVHGVRLRSGALLGLGFGAGYFGTLLIWMRVLGTDAWLAFALGMTLFTVALGVLLAAFSHHRCWPVWYATAWLAIEWARSSWPFGGVTWGRLGFASIDTPVEAWLPWVGVSGVGLLIALSGATLAWIFIKARPRAAVQAIVVGVVVVGAPWLLPTWSGTDDTLTVAIVQGGVPGAGDDLVGHHREVTRDHVTSTEQLAAAVAAGDERQPDLVVWPENSTAVDPFEDSMTAEGIATAVAAIKAPVLVGAIVNAPEPGRVLNQGILFSPGSGAGPRYTKHHPVPFGEYIPFRDLVGNWSSERLDLIPRDMIRGTGDEPLHAVGTELANAICFDVAYDDVLPSQVRNGARLAIVQTSNALFISTGQIEQQFAISRVRALETGRTVVVASVNGRSGVIGPDGEVQHAIALRGTEVAVVEVGLGTRRPPALWVGPVLGPVASGSVALGALLMVGGYLRLKRARRTATSPPSIDEGQGG